MFSIAGIDLLEQELLDHERTLLEILLQDKTTKKNIIWATDDYAELGEPYSFKKEILPELVTGEQDSLIQPRVEKHWSIRPTAPVTKQRCLPPVGSATHRTIWWMHSGWKSSAARLPIW